MTEINIREILKNGESSRLKNLPSFVYSIIERIIKQKQMNEVLLKYSEYEGVDFLNKLIEYLKLDVQIQGLENLPDNRRCFFIGNHAFGFIDGLIISKTISEKYGELKFIGNEVFLMIPNIKHMVAAVNMFDKSPREYLIELNKLYESDIPITHFPNGSVSRIYKGKIQDNLWHKSFISKAVCCQRDIVPFRFYGRNSYLFYTIFIIRKLLGIKREFETILLPREFFNKRNKTIKVKIGKPISYKQLNGNKSYAEWAEELRSEIYKL